ncbi:MAG: galactokinase family protein, partial [Alphaproteobacteria bacterium]
MSVGLRLSDLLSRDEVLRRTAGWDLSDAARQEKVRLLGVSAAALRQAGAPADAVAYAFFVPGRIEVLGKHTDYAGGRTMVAAVERGFCLAAVARRDATVRVIAPDTGQECTFTLAPDITPSLGHWSNYPMTVGRRLARNFGPDLRGADIAFTSDLPAAS